MLRLDRVGTVIDVPLQHPEDGVDPEHLADHRAHEARYAGVMARVALVDRHDAMAFALESDRMFHESQAAKEGAAVVETMRKNKAILLNQIAKMVRGVDLEIGGVDLTAVGGEELAGILGSAHDDLIVGRVAAVARNAQRPGAAAKNPSASSPSPSGDASPTSAP
jgi:hypothetical protein